MRKDEGKRAGGKGRENGVTQSPPSPHLVLPSVPATSWNVRWLVVRTSRPGRRWQQEERMTPFVRQQRMVPAELFYYSQSPPKVWHGSDCCHEFPGGPRAGASRSHREPPCFSLARNSRRQGAAEDKEVLCWVHRKGGAADTWDTFTAGFQQRHQILGHSSHAQPVSLVKNPSLPP